MMLCLDSTECLISPRQVKHRVEIPTRCSFGIELIISKFLSLATAGHHMGI